MAFAVTDYSELLTLHRGLLEAKFSDAPNDPALVGSSVLGVLIVRAIEEMKILLAEKGDRKAFQGWDIWRRRYFENDSREWIVCLDKARRIESWNGWHLTKKQECVENLFSPFILEPEVVSLFIRQVENKPSIG